MTEKAVDKHENKDLSVNKRRGRLISLLKHCW
jgi:hypothetical protein